MKWSHAEFKGKVGCNEQYKTIELFLKIFRGVFSPPTLPELSV